MVPDVSLCVAPLLVFALRVAPALFAAFAPAPPGEARLPVGYIPKDFLAYVAFIRESSDGAGWLLSDPFTTDPQSGRFLLLFHTTVGHFCAWTGLDPFVALELSRLPAYALFFAVVWRWTGLVWTNRHTRLWAYWLVALSGGLGYIGRLAVPLLPERLGFVAAQDLWTLYGWSTFEALYNPLWAAGLGLTLLVLEPVLRPQQPAAADLLQVGIGFFVLYVLHAYSAIVVLAVTLLSVALRITYREGGASLRAVRTLAGLGPALAAVTCLAFWQLRDPVFRETSGGMFGAQVVTPLWYPLGLGLIGILAVLGFRRGRAAGDPWALQIGGWVLAVAILHATPGLNGYHFLFHLHLPLALLAAPVAQDIFRSVRSLAGRGVLLAALFLSSLAVTIEAVCGVLRVSAVPLSWVAVARALARRPPANVLAPCSLGNVIPAYRAHRVWCGHWYLTPDFDERARRCETLFGDPAHESELAALLRAENIRYLVVPAGHAVRLLAALRERVAQHERAEDFEIVVLFAPDEAV